MEEHISKYRLSLYASQYLFAHIREGQLEEKFYQTIVETFGTQETRDVVYQLSSAEFFDSPWGLHLLISHQFMDYKFCVESY
jgi:hypothetical protein